MEDLYTRADLDRLSNRSIWASPDFAGLSAGDLLKRCRPYQSYLCRVVGFCFRCVKQLHIALACRSYRTAISPSGHSRGPACNSGIFACHGDFSLLCQPYGQLPRDVWPPWRSHGLDAMVLGDFYNFAGRCGFGLCDFKGCYRARDRRTL